MKIQVPIELCDVALASQTTLGTWIHTKTNLDTGDYDGNPVYEFEVVVSNGTTNSSYTVYIVNGAGTTLATITLNAGIAGVYDKPVRYRTTFTPTNGLDTYRVGIGATTANHDVEVYAARIIVSQDETATKTRIQIPLVSSDFNLPGATTTSTIDSTTSASYVQPTADRYAIFLLTLANFSTIATTNPYTLEAVVSNTANSPLFVSLFNKTTGNQVTNSQVSTTIGSVNVFTQNFSSDTNWIDGNEYEVRIKRNAGTGTPFLYKAALYVRLTSLSKAEVYWRAGKRGEPTVDTNDDQQRIFFDVSKYSNANTYWDYTLREIASGTNTLELLDALTFDSGQSSLSRIAISSNPSSSTLTRFRTPVALTTNHRMWMKFNVTSGQIGTANSFILILVTVPTVDTWGHIDIPRASIMSPITRQAVSFMGSPNPPSVPLPTTTISTVPGAMYRIIDEVVGY